MTGQAVSPVLDFRAQFAAYGKLIEQSLDASLPPVSDDAGGLVVDAARYSLLGGGKRLRPALLLATVEMLSSDPALIRLSLPFATALEMIHTYSLIHDDLPCMDDDQLRRGQPTCHVVYGEAIAVLSGDLLLNRAAELLIDQIGPGNPGTKIAAMLIMHAAGEQGMIGGQVLDLQSESRPISLDALRQLHRLKTGALLLAPLLAAFSLLQPIEDRTHLCGRSAAEWQQVHQALRQYGEAIGLAFQIRDDILDASSTPAMLGKSVGKDARDKKSTYVSLLGQDMAADHLRMTLATARQALENLRTNNLDTAFLSGLADYLLVRES